MSLALYSKYRRMKLRNAWHLAGMADFCFRCLIVAAVVCFAYALVAWVDYSAEQAELHGKAAQAEEVARLEAEKFQISGQLAKAMNGKSIRDADTGEVLFFDVSKQREL